jgi:hypothetical protein
MFDMSKPFSRAWPHPLVTINAVGAFLYLLSASNAWVVRSECEAGIHAISGEPFVWATSILPVVAVFLLINLVWGIILLRRRQPNTGRMWIAITAFWTVAALIDFSHHQC